MNRRIHILDGVLEAGIYALVIGSVLAFGTVEDWALAVMKFCCFLLFGVWFLKELWLSPKCGSPLGDPTGFRTGSFFGVRYKKTRLGIPILLFLLVILFQLLPLPKNAIERISPRTKDLYERTVPGFDGTSVEDFVGYSDWIMSRSRELQAPNREIDRIGEKIAGRSAEKPNLLRTLSINPYLTRDRLFRLLAYLAIFIVVVNHLSGSVRTRRAILVLVSSGFAIALFAIIQDLSWDGKIFWLRKVEIGSAFGPYVNHNHFAGFMVMIIPLALGALVALLGTGGGGRRPGGKGLLSRDDPHAWQQLLPKILLAMFGLGVLLAALVLSLSRGGIASMLASLCLFLVYGVRKRGVLGKLAVALLITGLVLAGLLFWVDPGDVVERLKTVSQLQNEPALKHRLVAWEDSFSLVRDYPLMGTGFGTFMFAFQPYYSPGFVKIWDRLHNDYLELLCDTGWIGFLIFFGGFLLFLRKYMVRPFFRGSADRNLEPLLVGCSVGMFAILLHSLVDFNLQIGANGLLFAILGGLLVGNLTRAGGSGKNGEIARIPEAALNKVSSVFGGKLGKVLVTLVVLSCLMMAGFGAERGIRADLLHRLADRSYWKKEYSDSRARYLEALSLNPADSNLWLHTGELYLAVLESGESWEDSEETDPWEVAGAAIRSLRRSLELNPAQSWPWSVLAQVFHQVKFLNQKDRVFDLGDLSDDPLDNLEPEDYLILALLSLARDHEPQSYFYHDQIGDTYWNAGLRERALESYRIGVQMAPQTELHLFLQNALLDPRLQEVTLEGFQDALENNRVLAVDEIYRQLAGFQESIGDQEGAIESFSRALDVRGTGSGVEEYHIGRLWRAKGEWEKSNRALLEFLHFDPNMGNAKLMVGLNYNDLGDPTLAVKFLREAIFLEPRRVRFHMTLARVYERNGNLEMAELEYRIAIQLDPAAGGVYPSLVKLLVETREYRKALNLLRDWKKMDPDNPAHQLLIQEVQSQIFN